jgi:uncharacterized protein (TIGR02646 family)
MQGVKRLALSKAIQDGLEKEQSALIRKHSSGNLNLTAVWKAARQKKALQSVLLVLREMAGARERCMYCVDSHGTDIEHFRPKTHYPGDVFKWSNLLLCCTECGRLKGAQFPLAKNGRSLLIDPSVEDPWRHIDFDSQTGNLIARFDLRKDDYSIKGNQTVAVLRLDRREALSNGYLITFRRLSVIVQAALGQASISGEALLVDLKEADDHGLLGWCFSTTGQTTAPFSDLHRLHPAVWAFCRQSLRSA